MDPKTYIESLDALDRAAQTLRVELDRTMDAMLRARAAAVEGAPLVDIVTGLATRQGGRDLRDRTMDSFAAFQQAMTAHRAAAIRALVDDGGMSFSAVAKLGGVSRQMIARLYRSIP